MQSSVSALVLAAFFALAGPPPAPPPATHVQSTQISAPTGLKSTLDQKTCNDHGGFAGGLACKAGLPNGMLALVWNYCSGCQADGFHLYRVDGGRRDAVSIPANGTSVTIALLDVPSDGFSGKCYAVTAYRGSAESALSAQFCVAGGSTIQTVSLTPQHSRMSSKTATAGSNCLSPGVTGEGSSTKVFSVGYYHYVDPHNDCDWHNSVDRSAFYFDVASIVHKTISSAHLHLRVAWTSVYNGSPGKNYDFKNMLTDHSTSCVDSIGVGREYWWEYEDWIAGDIVTSPGRYTGPDVSYDVTQIVKTWASGGSNFGIVLFGESEPTDTYLGRNRTNGFLSPSCQTSYDPSVVTLEVQYSS